MTQQSGRPDRIRLIYKRSSTLTKVLVLSAVVLSTAALLVLRGVIADTDAKNQALLGQAAQLEVQNAQLQQNIDKLGSLDSVIQIAGDELGLVDPNTVVLVPEN